MSAVKMGLTIEEAAECTGIGRNTMRKLVDWGKLPVLKVGRKAIIRRDTLERNTSWNGSWPSIRGGICSGRAMSAGSSDGFLPAEKSNRGGGDAPAKYAMGEVVQS